MEERRVETVAEKVEDKLGREDVPRDVVEATATLDVVEEAYNRENPASSLASSRAASVHQSPMPGDAGE